MLTSEPLHLRARFKNDNLKRADFSPLSLFILRKGPFHLDMIENI
jgi:hypothetical protein